MSKITESIGKEIISKYNNGIKVRDIVKEVQNNRVSLAELIDI